MTRQFQIYIIGCFPDDSYTTDLLAKIEDEQLREDVQSVLIPREKLVIGDAIGKGKALANDGKYVVHLTLSLNQALNKQILKCVL